MENVIQLQSDDIIENLDDLLKHSTLFQTNSNLESVNCFIFYTENRKLLNYKKYEIDIHDNKLTKKELLSLVLKNNKHHFKKFDLTSIFKYEIVLEESKIKDFCQNPQDFCFMKEYKNIEEINFKPCIELFNENNCIMLIFSRKTEAMKETTDEKHNKTKKRVKFNLKNRLNLAPSSSANKTKKSV